MSTNEPPAAGRLSEHVWRLPLATATLPPYDHVNAYLVASNGVGALIDPGAPEPGSQAAIDALLAAEGVRLLKLALLTHTHADHVGGLPALLARHPELPVYLHGAEADALTTTATKVRLPDDAKLTVGDAVVRVLHTPGHSPGHLSFEVDGLAIVGDLVAGSGSSWVGLPGGDVATYLRSLERLAAERPELLAPGHGPVIRDPQRKLAEAADHRLARERQLLDALSGAGPASSLALAQLRERLYPDLDPRAEALADGSILAHLVKLMAEMKVVHLGDGPDGPYALRR